MLINYLFRFSANVAWFTVCCSRSHCRFTFASVTHVIFKLIVQYVAFISTPILDLKMIPEQFYNADETGLSSKCLPQRTFVSCQEKCAPGFKKAKDRLTVLGCTNALGTHKLKPVLIGKSTKPRCFKHVNMDALPVIYTSKRNAWMNSEIFAEWFKKDFVPAVKSHQRSQSIRSPKALPLIDKCSAHPGELSSRDSSVTCLFLPPNMTSLIQPMDQGVLQAMKNRYKRKLLQKVICSQDIDQTQSIKNIRS